MLGKILGALIGAEIERGRRESGLKGAALGVAGAVVVKRLGPLGLIVGGAYVAKKMYDRSRRGATAA